MRLLIFLFVGLLALGLACTPKPVETTVHLPGAEKEPLQPESLQGEWHMITQVEGEWILFYPCDADNTFIQLKADSIIIGWGQDATAGKIENWSTDEEGLTLAVNDSYAVNTYRVNAAKDYTEWWLWEDADGPSRFIHASQKSNYKEVRQPCKECWEDCEEDQ